MWETAGDARDFIKKQLLELNAKDFLSVGFFFMTGYMIWRALGRVPQFDYERDADYSAFEDRLSFNEWFWGRQRIIFITMLIAIRLIAEMKFTVPSGGGLEFQEIKPFAWLALILKEWEPVCMINDGYDEAKEVFYFKAVPIEFRALLVLSFISILFLLKEFLQTAVGELGELIPG